MKMQLNCGCCTVTYGQFPTLVDVQPLPSELGTEETSNWTRINWPMRDFWTIMKWVGTSPTSYQSSPVRYTYNLDLTEDWNPLNAMWLRGGTGTWCVGSYPENIPAKPRHIRTVSLTTGAFTNWVGIGRTGLPIHPVDKFRVWVDGVDVTGIKSHTGLPGGLIDLGLSFSKAEPYKQVFIDVDVWFAPYDPAYPADIEIIWGNALSHDPQINFDYEFRKPLTFLTDQQHSLTGQVYRESIAATVSTDSVWGTHYPTGTEVIPWGCSIPSGYRKKSASVTHDLVPGPFPAVGLWGDTDTPEVLERAVSSNGWPYVQPATSSSTVTVTKV